MSITDPSTFAGALKTALEKGEAERLCALPPVGFDESTGEHPVGFLRQLNRKKLVPEPHGEARRQDDRALAPIDLVQGERRQGPLFLLLKQGRGSWQLSGVTRSPGHAEGFLAGRLPPLLRWEDLQPQEDLLSEGRRIVEEAGRAEELTRQPDTKEGQVISTLAGLRLAGWELSVEEAVGIPTAGRGAIRLKSRSPDGEENDLWVYLAKDDAGTWRAFTHEYMARLGTLLDTPA